jgi:hypothetical protein
VDSQRPTEGGFAVGRGTAPTSSSGITSVSSPASAQLASMTPWMQAHVQDITWMRDHMSDLVWLQTHPRQWQWIQSHPTQWRWVQSHRDDIA